MYEEFKLWPKSEFVERWKKVQALMGKYGVDALLLSMDTNFFYLTGSEPPFGPTRPQLLVVPKEGEPVAIVAGHPVLEKVQRQSYISDVRVGNPLQVSPERVKEVVEDVGARQGKIGTELGLNSRLGMSLLEFRAVQEALPEAEFLDASTLMFQARMIKSPLEIEAHRKSCEISDKAHSLIVNIVKREMTERELARILMARMMEEEGYSPFVYVRSGEGHTGPLGTARFFTINSTKKIKDGRLLVDIGCCYNYYWSDFDRIYWVGRPTESEVRRHDVTTNMLESALKQVKNGVNVSQLVESALNSYKRSGLSGGSDAEETATKRSGRIGHGLGLDPAEPPDISLDSTMKLKAGIVFALEPSWTDNYGRWILEQDVLVTKDGYELLSKAPLEIQTIT
jgi:Xaa-Pro aminopeptidase